MARNWNKWGIHNLVVEELREWDVHPMMILIQENDTSTSWPSADFYIPKILDTLGMKLFGEEAFPGRVEVLRTNLCRCLQIFAQRSWDTICVQVAGLRSHQNEIEATVIAAFKGVPSRFSCACQ